MAPPRGSVERKRPRRGVVAGEGVVEAGFGIAFVAGEFVVGRAGGGLQSSRVGDFLAIRCEVGIVAKLAGGLAGAAAGGDSPRGAELVGKVVEDVAGTVAGSDAASGEEDVFILRVARAVRFGERVAGEGAPVEFHEGAAATIAGGAGFLGDAESETVVDVAVRAAGGSGRQREAVFGIKGIRPTGAAAILGHVSWGIVRISGIGIDVVVGIHSGAQCAIGALRIRDGI